KDVSVTRGTNLCMERGRSTPERPEQFSGPRAGRRARYLSGRSGSSILVSTKMIPEFEVAIVGAGPAGLSAALMLGRCRRKVVVFDDGQPRNAASLAAHGYLTR